jgi:polygalacturonase
MKLLSKIVTSTSKVLICCVAIGVVHPLSMTANEPHRISNTPSIPGAYGDGSHLDTKAIQHAIDSVASLGGGVVLLANGRYLSAPLTLKSNITFQIDSTAVLLASQNVHDYYPAGTDTTKPATSLVHFLSSKYANNVTLLGPGTIDGQGQPWWDAENVAKAGGRDTLRPRLIQLESGVHITVSNITLKNAPMFHLCPNSSYDVKIDRVTIIAPSTAPNTDGIDPGKCHHVRITNCYIDTGDDNIAVGASSADAAWPNAASSDIIISHCTFLHGHGCSIGSLTVGGVDSMLVDSCTFNGTDNGIRIKSARGSGGNVRNLTYTNLTMTNVRYPIYLSEYYPKIPAQSDTAQPITASSKTPSYHDITIANVSSSNTASNSTAGVIVGLPETKLTNIHLKNVTITAQAGVEIRNAGVDTLNTKVTVASGAPFLYEINSSITRGTLLDVSSRAALPTQFQLSQNYPNPFNPTTTIDYTLPARSTVRLLVYNTLGQVVKELVNAEQGAGMHAAVWDARVPSGLYFYRIEAAPANDPFNRVTVTKKMLLVK